MQNDDELETPETPETPADAEPNPNPSPSPTSTDDESDPASADSMPTVSEPEQLEPVAVPESDGDSLLPEGAYVDYPDGDSSSS